MHELEEILENRITILKGYIAGDKALYNDPFLSQHARGKVSIEEKWLEETERLLEWVRSYSRN